METSLTSALGTLRANERSLRELGVLHASVFGSVARGEATPESDLDVLVELDRSRPIGLFEYARLKLYIADLFGGSCDVVNRHTLKPFLRDNILTDAVDAF